MRRSTAAYHALLLSLAAGVTACGGSGPADADADGRTDTVDLCPETPAGTSVGPDGCGATDDGDRDGLKSGDDVCAGTAPGAEVDAFGCSKAQREQGIGSSVTGGSGEPREDGTGTPNMMGAPAGSSAASTAAESKGLIEHPPETGTVTNGYVALVLDRNTSRPFVFHTFASNVTKTDAGFDVHGALLLATPLGQLPIANASVTFAYGADASAGLETVRGDANVPFPSLGAAQGFSADDLVSASLGFDSGENLADLGAPLNDDRKYLFFQFAAGVSVHNGPLTLSLPGGEDATLVLDPFDPFVFASGSLLGLGALGPIEGVGLGVSAQGLIPFHATTTRGITQGLEDFKGALYLSGSVPLARLPLTVTGEAVLDIDPNADGRPLTDLDAVGFQLGVNGELDLTASFLDVFSFETSLANASVKVRATADEQRAALSGVIEPDQSFLPDELPLRADGQVNVSGLIASDIDASFLHADGKFQLVGSTLAKHVGVDLSNLAVVDAELDIDHEGFRLTGKLGAGVKLTSDLTLGADAKVTATFGDDPEDFVIDIEGDLEIAKVPLLNGKVRLDGDGAHVSGKLDTGVGHVALTGEITRRGVELSGEAGVSVDVSAGKDEIELVTDGALCGYEYVKDGALCGYHVVTDGTKCGYGVVTDAGRCGYNTVTDGIQCGYPVVTDAAKCGTHIAESAFYCGVSGICDFFGFCSAKSCDVPSSCPDVEHPKSCTDFSSPASCEDLTHPNTCDDLSQPKECEDLSQPKTCEKHHVIPDFDFGKFEGKVVVTLGSKGIGGDVSGEYCPTSGSCQKLAGGSVKLGDPLEACIDVPGGVGEFCAPF